MATVQALSVFLQNQSACAECASLGRHRCPDRWFHENTGVCGSCEAVWEYQGEHNTECLARDDRILAQACSALRSTFRSKTSIEEPESAAAPSHGGDFHGDSESSFESELSFDQGRIEHEHFQICEWCSPFHRGACDGTRECLYMASFTDTLACLRMTYVCRNMPVSNPRDCPLQARILALAILCA